MKKFSEIAYEEAISYGVRFYERLSDEGKIIGYTVERMVDGSWATGRRRASMLREAGGRKYRVAMGKRKSEWMSKAAAADQAMDWLING